MWPEIKPSFYPRIHGNKYVCRVYVKTHLTHLRGDDEESALCVELGQGLVHVRAVDVGDEPNIGPAFGVRLQSLSHHQGTLGRGTRSHSFDASVDHAGSMLLYPTA